MKAEIKVPPLGESVSEATISRLIKTSGSSVKLDEEIIELETDKVNQVLYAPQNGKLMLSVNVGDKVTVGQVIGHVDTEAKGVSAEPENNKPSPPPTPPPTIAAPQKQPPTSTETSRVPVSEFVSSLKASPPPQPTSTPNLSRTTPTPSSENLSRKKMSSLRKVIAERLVKAKNTTAMLTTFNEVDMSAILEIRAREKEGFPKKHGVKLGFMSFFIKGVVASLKANPQVNASIDGEDILVYNTYDIGVAVSTDRGLVVPVLKGCDKLSFGGIEKQLETYAQKARAGSISMDDLRGGSFTITNGGVFGSLLSTPILNPPQSAILGMHAIVKRPVVVNDTIVIRPMMYLALSYDHRIIDGKEAVLFLVHLKQNLEDPSRLLLDL